MAEQTSAQRRWRDPVSGGTHLAGAVLGAIGSFFLLWRSAATGGSTKHFVAFSIFGVSLVLLYLSSATYHLLYVPEHRQRFLRRLDHSMIYVLIAGSYTPMCLLALPKHLGIPVLIAVWAVAFAGSVGKLLWLGAPRWLSTALYLGMGWAALVIVVPLARALGTWGTLWLVAGGLAYSVGAVIYAMKRPDPWPGVFGFHEIWHLHVLAGSFFHFLCVATLVPA